MKLGAKGINRGKIRVIHRKYREKGGNWGDSLEIEGEGGKSRGFHKKFWVKGGIEGIPQKI